jgi:hypothetical protein
MSSSCDHLVYRLAAGYLFPIINKKKQVGLDCRMPLSAEQQHACLYADRAG